MREIEYWKGQFLTHFHSSLCAPFILKKNIYTLGYGGGGKAVTFRCIIILELAWQIRPTHRINGSTYSLFPSLSLQTSWFLFRLVFLLRDNCGRQRVILICLCWQMSWLGMLAKKMLCCKVSRWKRGPVIKIKISCRIEEQFPLGFYLFFGHPEMQKETRKIPCSCRKIKRGKNEDRFWADWLKPVFFCEEQSHLDANFVRLLASSSLMHVFICVFLPSFSVIPCGVWRVFSFGACSFKFPQNEAVPRKNMSSRICIR